MQNETRNEIFFYQRVQIAFYFKIKGEKFGAKLRVTYPLETFLKKVRKKDSASPKLEYHDSVTSWYQYCQCCHQKQQIITHTLPKYYPTFSYSYRNITRLYQLEYHSQSCQQAHNYGGPGGQDPCTFPEKDKSGLFLLYDLPIITFKSEWNEIRKIPVIFLPFLNLKNSIPSNILTKKS